MNRFILLSGIAVVLLLSSCSHRSDVIREVRRDVVSLNLRGNDLYWRGQYEEAAKLYDRAKLAAMSIDDRSGVAESINNLGQLYLVAGDAKSAETKFSEACSINEESGNLKDMAANLNNRGNARRLLGFADLAMEDLEVALDLYKKKVNRLGEATVINNMGLVALSKGDLDSARSRFGKALELALHLKRHRLAAACFTNLGSLDEKTGDLESARMNYERALEEDKMVEYSVGIAEDLQNLARVLAAQDMFSRSQDCLDRSLAIKKQLGLR